MSSMIVVNVISFVVFSMSILLKLKFRLVFRSSVWNRVLLISKFVMIFLKFSVVSILFC